METKKTYYRATQNKPNELGYMTEIKVYPLQSYKKHDDTYFDTPEEAYNSFKKALDESVVQFKTIQEELKQLQDKLKFSISYAMEGDTHGIYEDYQCIEIKIRNYYFIYKIDQ